MKHNQFRQVVFPIITAMIWGSSFVAQSTSTEHVGAYTFNAARSFVGFLALLVVVQIFKMLRKEPPAEQTAAEKKAGRKDLILGGICCGIALALACNLQQLEQMFIESGNSKIIVYQGDIDHVVGYIHSSEMFRCPDDWKQKILKIPFVPETMAAQKLMKLFMQQKKSLAIVVDEFGGTSGLVSLEDIVEEIFGDIEDEHDSTKYTAVQTEDHEYILSARLEIDKVNELFDLDLPESDDYMTLGGMILHYYQSFPKLNEVVTIGKYEFKILKNTMTKIELVKLKILS